MNNRQKNKSLIALRCGLSSFLIYCMLLFFMAVFLPKLLSYYPWLYDRGGEILRNFLLVIAFISLVLGLTAFIYSILVNNTSNVLNNYFVKLALSYGISTMVIWLFLGLSFFIFIITNIANATVTLKQKILFFIILTILSLAPLVLHGWFRAKFIRMNNERGDIN